MAKTNYFELIEELAGLAEDSVRLASCSCGSGALKEQTDVRRKCDALICELEDALFVDFLPPLERDSIAACAHCFSRIIDKAADLSASLEEACKVNVENWNAEGEICQKLAQMLKSQAVGLRYLRKPSQTPALKEFRKLLGEGRRAHSAMLKKLNSGTLPRSYNHPIRLTARLRAELSAAFDNLVEIMLDNI